MRVHFANQRLAAIFSVAVCAFALSGCDDFQPAFGIGSDGEGGVTFLPVVCSSNDRVFELKIEDAESGATLWHVRSDTGIPAESDFGTSHPWDGTVVTPWNEPLRSLSAGLLLTFSMDLFHNGRRHDYHMDFQVAEVDVRPDAVRALYYGVVPVSEFRQEIVPAACHQNEGLLGDWLNRQPRWFAMPIVLILSVAPLFALGLGVWGVAVWLGRLRRRRAPQV
jgi:hypothetical protein